MADKLTLFERFQEEMQQLHGHAELVASDRVADAVRRIARKFSLEGVVGYQSPLIEDLRLPRRIKTVRKKPVFWIPPRPPEGFDRDGYREKLLTATLAIEAADYLIAQTGTAVVVGQQHRSKMATLTTPVLIFLAPLSGLFPDLFQFQQHFRQQYQQFGSLLTYITGPSRTADIEKTLILGVHGPRHLFVLVVSDK